MREIYLPAFEAAVTQGHVDCGDGLLQPDQRGARHAERLPQSQGPQGRLGLQRRADVRLGRDLRRRCRCQQRPRSRNALAALHECADALRQPSKAAPSRNRQSTTRSCACYALQLALWLARSPAIRSRRFNLLGGRSRHRTARARSKALRCSRTKATSFRSMQPKSKRSPSSVPMRGLR